MFGPIGCYNISVIQVFFTAYLLASEKLLCSNAVSGPLAETVSIKIWNVSAEAKSKVPDWGIKSPLA